MNQLTFLGKNQWRMKAIFVFFAKKKKQIRDRLSSNNAHLFYTFRKAEFQYLVSNSFAHSSQLANVPTSSVKTEVPGGILSKILPPTQNIVTMRPIDYEYGHKVYPDSQSNSESHSIFQDEGGSSSTVLYQLGLHQTMFIIRTNLFRY